MFYTESETNKLFILLYSDYLHYICFFYHYLYYSLFFQVFSLLRQFNSSLSLNYIRDEYVHDM